MSEQKFHKENWVEYYDVKLDESSLEDEIDSSYEGTLINYDLSGDVLRTRTSSQVYDYIVYDTVIDINDEDEDEEIEVEFSVDARFSYTTSYHVCFDEIDIEELEESLQYALNSGSSKFEIEVEAEMRSVSNIDVDVESFEADEDIHFADPYEVIAQTIEYELTESRYQAHAGDMIQPPIDKTLRFICTIPNT